jgi:hypothetical protein
MHRTLAEGFDGFLDVSPDAIDSSAEIAELQDG